MHGRVVALTGPGKLEIQTYELDPPPEGGANLRVRRAQVCGSDVHMYHFRNPNFRNVVLGHEFVGEIVTLGPRLEVDSAGSPVTIGDRVVVVYFQTCGRCIACGRGEPNMCVNSIELMRRPPTATPHFHGAFASHYRLSPGQSFYKVPDEVSDAEVAGANCGLAQMLFSLDGVGLNRARTVVVQGAGGLGLYATAIAHHSGARVVVVEKEPVRIAAARAFGASEVIDMSTYATAEQRRVRLLELTHGHGADLVVEVTGHPEAFQEAVGFARTGGSIAAVGNLNAGDGFEVKISPAVFTRKNLRVHGYLRYDPWYLKRAVDFISDTREQYPFESLSDRVYGLEDVHAAIAGSESRQVARPAIIPS